MGKLLRRVGLALLFSLLFGFALGIALQVWLARPVHYIGAREISASGTLAAGDARSSAPPRLPLDVGQPGATVLDARHDEEQVGQSIEVAQQVLVERILAV